MFNSPFAARYGSDEMRALWSDAYRRTLWRRMWVALAEAQAARRRRERPRRLKTCAPTPPSPTPPARWRSRSEIGHDVMAELRAFAEQCPVGGGILHSGATSADITDNADVLRQREALRLLRERLAALLAAFAAQIDTHSRAGRHGLHPPAARRADHPGLPPGRLRPGPARAFERP